MQRMAHFMEQGHRLVERQQAGIAFAEIGIVGDDGNDIIVFFWAVQFLLVAEAGHPGAALLAGAGKVIAIEQPDHCAILDNLPQTHIGMIDRHVAALLERQTKQLLGSEEGCRDQIGQLEIRLHQGFVELVVFLAQLFGVIAPVPGRQREVVAFARDQ